MSSAVFFLWDIEIDFEKKNPIRTIRTTSGGNPEEFLGDSLQNLLQNSLKIAGRVWQGSLIGIYI